MTGLRRHAHIFLLLAMLMAVVMLIGRTTRRSRATRTRSTSTAMPHAVTPPPVKPAPVAQPATPPAAVVAPATGVGAGKPAAAAVNIVAQQMRETDAADRALLVAFERAGAKWPVQVAHDLIAAQKRGVPAVELEHTIASSLAGNLPAQMAARRWLRDETGGGETRASTTTSTDADARKVIGNGGGTRRVTDVRKAQ
jgi:hypothetical protein